jgi:DNA polymerase III subunit chi
MAAAGPVVEFRTGVRDKLGYAARWLAVAARQGARVRVWASDVDARQIGQALWTADKEGFIAHLVCPTDPADGGRSGDATQIATVQTWLRTPIWLGCGAVPAPEPALLLNLSQDLPADVVAYARVIEVVATAPAEEAAGRQRWATYKQRGLTPVHRAPGGAGANAGEEPA